MITPMNSKRCKVRRDNISEQFHIIREGDKEMVKCHVGVDTFPTNINPLGQAIVLRQNNLCKLSPKRTISY